MRRLLIALASAAVLAAAIAFPVAASDEMCASGRAFGEMHAMEAGEGMLGGAAYPGMHRGFSACLPS